MRVFLTIIILFCFGCNGNSSSQTEVVTATSQDSLSLTKKEIDTIDYIEYGFSSASTRAMQNWTGHDELEEFLNAVKNADLSFLSNDEEIIKAFIKDLKSSVPESINSDAITARLTALETKFYKLKSAASISNTSKEELLNAIKEFFVANSDLNLQINKKFEKEAQDIRKSNL